MSMIAYKTDKQLPCKQLYNLFAAVGWADTQRTTEAMIANFNTPFINATFVVSAWDGEKLVGCIRALSDRIFRSVIYDIAVLPEYQGNGIGRELIQRCISYCPNSEWLVATTPEQEEFYTHLGFKATSESFLHLPCKWF